MNKRFTPQATLVALLVLSTKTVLVTLLVVLVLRLTHVLPFVPIFDFHIRSAFGVKDLTIEEVEILREKLEKAELNNRTSSLLPTPTDSIPDQGELLWDSETGDPSEDIFAVPEEIPTPEALPEPGPYTPPMPRPSLNAKLPVVEIKSSSIEHAW